MEKIYSLYTDAGSRGNPGKSSYGFFIFEDQKLLDFGGQYLGIRTNNQGEFIAMQKGIELAIKLGIKNLDCFSDSQLLIRQLNGIYKVKDMTLKSILNEINILKYQFEKITFTHVFRENNKFADKMVNLILDAQGL